MTIWIIGIEEKKHQVMSKRKYQLSYQLSAKKFFSSNRMGGQISMIILAAYQSIPLSNLLISLDGSFEFLFFTAADKQLKTNN
jgi:hypothetical protein